VVFVELLGLGGRQAAFCEAEDDEIAETAGRLDSNPVPDPYGPMGGCPDVVYRDLPAGTGLLGQGSGLEHTCGQQPAVDPHTIAVLRHVLIPHMKVLDRQRSAG